MKYIKIEDLHKVVQLDKKITSIQIENTVYYRKVHLDYINSVSFYDDINLIPYKNINVIKNLFELNLDDKKTITKLHSYLLKFSNMETNEKMSKIERLMIELISLLEENTNFNLDYNDKISIDQILSIYKVKIDDNTLTGNYLEKLIAYLNFNYEVMGDHLFLSFGLHNYLTKDELEVLKYELKSYDFQIVDVFLCNKNSKEVDLIIDKDMCII